MPSSPTSIRDSSHHSPYIPPSTQHSQEQQQQQDHSHPPLQNRLHALLSNDAQSTPSPTMTPSSESDSFTRGHPTSTSNIDSRNAETSSAVPRRRSDQSNKRYKGAVPVIPPPASAAGPSRLPQIRTSDLHSPDINSKASALVSPGVLVSPTSSGPSRSSSLDPSHVASTSNSHPSPPTSSSSLAAEPPRPQTRQRPSIKVRIITWNMHDSLPKGDLEVLLGKAGTYVAPEAGWDVSFDSADEGEDEAQASRGKFVVGQESIPRPDRIPPLPHDDSHPYHLLVIAGQECPWGDGKRLATSVGMAGELGDIGKQKNRSMKDKEKDRDKSYKQSKLRDKDKENQKSAGSSDPIPIENRSANAPSTMHDQVPDDIVTSPSCRDGLADMQSAEVGSGFPFMAPPVSNAIAGHPLASPWIGGSQMPGLAGHLSSTPSRESSLPLEDKLTLGAWPNIGGKGWSDMCDDWLCKNQTAKKEKDKSFMPGARLARALSNAAVPSKKASVLTNESHFDSQIMPQQTRSAAVTPDLSRAASPIGMVSASAPGTPIQSAFDGFDQAMGSSPSSFDLLNADHVEKRRRMVPKLNLKAVDRIRRSSPAPPLAGADAPTGSEYVASPTVVSPVASYPSADQHLSLPTSSASPTPLPPSLPSSASLFSNSGGLLSVPTAPSMSRMSSSSSLSKIVEKGEADSDAASTAADGAGQMRIEPPTPSRSPSPYPHEARSQNNGSPLPSQSASAVRSALLNDTPVKSSTDATPKSLGPYELVIKERMMGCYMAIYVWRGCKDRIRGASRSHVKSGLLAGRLGNKGGVGISVKLGPTRLLFVNAHLAAHEDKVALRLANVAKIKAALKVDSFLPKTDPRSKLEDITEQFDHCFWFGDLNFRIDISRQHADWLLMHKKYDQALAFDQLGKVLKEGIAFRGFKEAPIAFPPTYKYDVLKTLKIKRTKTLSSIKSGIDVPNAGMRTATSELSLNPLVGGASIPEEHVLELGPEDTSYLGTSSASNGLLFEERSAMSSLDPETAAAPSTPTSTSTKASRAARRAQQKLKRGVDDGEKDESDRSDDDQHSMSSSAFDSVGSSSGFATSFLTQQNPSSQQQGEAAAQRERELESERQRVLHENTAAASGPKFFSQGAAIKAKFKLMDIVRSATSTNLKEKIGVASSEPSAPNAEAGAGGVASGPARKTWLGALTDSPRRIMTPSSPYSADYASGPESLTSESPTKPQAILSEEGDQQLLHPSGRRSSLLSTEGLPDVNTSQLVVLPPASDAALSSNEEDTVLSLESRPRSATQVARANSRIAKAKRDAKYPHLTGATAEQIDYLEAQPYDTSSKQRVPSWCDRVLFRSTVLIDPEDDSDAENEAKREGIGSRVGSALSNALIAPIRQAAERRQQMHAQRTASSGLIAAVAGSSSIAFAQEQTLPAEVSLVDPAARKASLARRDRAASTSAAAPLAGESAQHKAVERKAVSGSEKDTTRTPHLLQRFLHPSRRRNQMKALSPSLTLADLSSAREGTLWSEKKDSSVDLPSTTSFGLGLGLGLAGMENKALSSVDLPSQIEQREKQFDGAKKEHLKSSRTTLALSPVIPPRLSSVSQSTSPTSPHLPLLSPSSEEHASIQSPVSPPAIPIRSHTSPAPAKTDDDQKKSRDESTGRSGGQNRRWQHQQPSSSSSTAATTGSWFESLSSHLPFLAPALSAMRNHHQHHHSHTNTTGKHGSALQQEEEKPILVGPKRGRIQVLLYKSLDDREMRSLEGRSDHRPVIFVGAIGI